MGWSSGKGNARIPRREPPVKRKHGGWFTLGVQKMFWKAFHDKGKLLVRRDLQVRVKETNVCILVLLSISETGCK